MPPISRREALAAGLVAATGLTGHAAPVPKGDNKSWVGKTVLPKRPDPVGHTLSVVVSEEGQPNQVEAPQTLHAAAWEVKAEKGARVEVFENGTAFWVEKDLLVPLADAVAHFTQQIKDDANDAYAHNFRGWAQHLLGKHDAAVKDFTEFLNLVPADADQHRLVGFSNRGAVLAELGKFDDAIKDLDEAVRIGHRPAVLNRGWTYELKGDYKKALADYGSLLVNNANDAHALNAVAWVRATCPVAGFRDGAEALRRAKLACELTGSREGAYLDTLAAAHAETGDFAAAVKAQEQALADPGYAKRFGDDAQKRLALYKDKKPFRTEPLKAK